MSKRLLTLSTLAGLALVSPASADDGGQFASTVLGMGIGGIVGNMIGHGDGRVAATAAGVVVGGFIGNELARPASAEPVYMAQSYNSGPYPYDMFSTTTVPYRPNYVAPAAPPVPPPVTYMDDDTGNYCREFSQSVRVGNTIRESYGTACLQPDGSWHVVR